MSAALPTMHDAASQSFSPAMNLRSRPAWRRRWPRSADLSPFLVWLRDRGSLTLRLKARGEFAVHLLRQGLFPPTREEAAALGIRPDERAWIREVALYCDGVPVVFAHSVLPRRPRGPMTRALARLGERSLGALLFSHAGFARGALAQARLDARCRLFAAACEALGPAPALWARRSRFAYGGQSVLVTEIFSPAVLDTAPKAGGATFGDARP